jgi:hypothetical protein
MLGDFVKVKTRPGGITRQYGGRKISPARYTTDYRRGGRKVKTAYTTIRTRKGRLEYCSCQVN